MRRRKLSEVEDKRKIRKRIVIRSLILIAFLLTINTFAWFTYISKVGVTLNASVVNWDVTFLEETNVVKEIVINVTDMKPGMLPVEKEVIIKNGGEVPAGLSYVLESVTLLGKDIKLDKTVEEIKTSLANDYPFKLSLTLDKTIIPPKDSGSFKMSINWEYEATEYYKLNDFYTYDEAVYYYTLHNGTYQVDNSVTATNFNDKVTSGLYLEKDDADSFWGYTCGKYENETGKPCLKLVFKLNAYQAE